jgi:phage terminase small subunit
MSILANEQHEAFAQARFAGQSLTEAHYTAGFAGDKASASRLNRTHEVQERIAELFREAAAQVAYEKTDAARDLLAIIHTPPSDADEDHPLCEVRMGKDGPYHRLPPKLQAMARLIKLMGWDQPLKIEVRLKDTLGDILYHVVVGRHRPPVDDPEPAEWVEEPERLQWIEESGTPSTENRASSTDPPTMANNRKPPPSTGNTPLPPRQEQFALARVKGLGVMAAYHAAGYTGDSANLAWRLHAMPEIQARIAHFNGGVADALGYRRDDAVRDLIFIIRAKPTEVSPDHPYCEKRLTSWGEYHRFPSKMGALNLLARMLGWNGPTALEVAHDPDASLREFWACIRSRAEESRS